MTGVDLSALLIAWSIQAAGVISPGPGVALLLGVGMASGRRAALAATCGIAICAALFACLTVIGLAAVLSQARELIIVVKIIGAGYLLYLAYGAFRKAAWPPLPPVATMVTPTRRTWRFVGTGFLMQLSNPKAIFFWVAIAAVGSLGAASAITLAVFVAGAFAISLIGHGGWAILLSSTPIRALYARARRVIEGALGAFFTIAAYKVATTRIA